MKGITSPEGIIMLMVAATLDVIGIIIFLLGTWFAVDDYGILEIVATAIIGTWMFIRHGSLGSEGGMKPTNDDGAEKESENPEEMPEKEKKEEVKEEKKEKNNETENKATDGGVEKMGKQETSTPKKPNAPPESKKDDPKVPKETKPQSSIIQAGDIKDIMGGDVKGVAKKAIKRYLWTLLIELFPFLGGFWPGWTIFVWREMSDKPSKPKETMAKPKKTQGDKKTS